MPAHIACSRQCSPRTLEMLLKHYPEALTAETQDDKKETLFSLACTRTNKTRQNIKLKKVIKLKLQRAGHWTSEMEALERLPPRTTEPEEQGNSVTPHTPQKRKSVNRKVSGTDQKCKRKTAVPQQVEEAETELKPKAKRKSVGQQVDGTTNKRKRKTVVPVGKKASWATQNVQALEHSTRSKGIVAHSRLPLKKRPVYSEVAKLSDGIDALMYFARNAAGPRGNVASV